jgi:putative ABC transport system ATP-binding protein
MMIRLAGVGKVFPAGERGFTALDGIDLEVAAGEFVAIVGKSGSGKSTLLNLIAGIDRPTAGTVEVAGTAIHGLDESRLAAWRGRHVGVVFQSFQLLPTLTVLENVTLPMDFCGTLGRAQARARAVDLLRQMDIEEQAGKLPANLSGGQQQRAAIARALANDPPLIVADEPTGNLDSQTSAVVMRLLADLSSSGKTVLMVTHERELSRLSSRIVTLADGRIVADSRGKDGRRHTVPEVADAPSGIAVAK